MAAPALHAVRETFRAVALVVLPETASLHPDGWNAFDATVERALASRPPSVRRQLTKFLRMVEYLPALKFGASFRGLSPERQLRWLQALETSRFELLRRGMWGVRTLIFMGYYTQPEVQTAIGYRAHPEGWQLRRRSGEFPAYRPQS